MDTQNLSPLKNSDKTIGYLLIAVVMLVGGSALYYALPYLIELAKNTIIFVGELIALALLAIVFLDPSTWQSIYYKWRNISRSVRKAIIREDPVGVLQTVINRFSIKLGEIDDNITRAVGAAKRQQKVITQAYDQMKQELAMAKTAKALGKELEIKQHAGAAARWQKTAEEMKPLEETLLGAKSSLERARDLCASRLEDLKNQKQVLGLKLEALKDGQTAVKGFKRFFGSNPDLEMQELAVDEIERQSAEAEAEIEQFIRVMNPMLDTQDLKKSAEALAAMEKFNNYLTGAGEPKLITDGAIDADILEHDAQKTEVA